MATQEVDAEVGEAVDAKANVGIRGDPSEEAKTFYKLMEDLELPLYPGCKNFSKLSFLLKLFHIKCLGGITDKSLSMILDLFKEALPENNTLPESFYEAQKTVKKLSLNSIKIDACPNNCMLFWKEHANADECIKCHASRWKKKEQGNGNPTTEPNPKKLPCQTMSDYPAYGDLSGWSTGGEKGCPTCNSDTSSEWLRNGGKYCYMCHRRFLPIDHEWRYDGASFDGTHEIRPKPKELTGEEVLEQLVDVECVTSLETPTRKRNRRKDQKNKCKAIWRKKSIFYELPYWSSLLVRHNLDVMHIEKNVCETLLATLLDIEGKSKDNLNARHDLKEMKIRKSQHAKERDDGSWEIPPAPYTLSLEEKKKLCTFLTSVKFPDGYASNISRNSLLRERKLAGLKSHDFHVIMEHLLPLAIRDWPKSLSTPLIKLSSFFKELCSKTLNVKDLEIMDKEIAVILCE
ncbi:uncharacterized protein LOC130589918 [Beta vulgaris subsp. vulgaris]|uniref:uncharacterized protein LOC130589918 n=1 Tax=Beta vulgaris subsp. vulgaris TaxID=3555 RepID=UPI0025480EA1|nr:uncharacterized protein LOC130589918 [Beta vulgaris subsp. vulgaris]